MPYLIDRQRALRTQDVVALMKGVQPRVRSQGILRDNSLYRTMTRPKTLLRYIGEYPETLYQATAGRPATRRRNKAQTSASSAGESDDGESHERA